MIKHVLKDGTKLTSIKDHVVKQEDAETIYALIDRINGEEKND